MHLFSFLDATDIKQLLSYHPAFGLALVVLLISQPSLEVLNYRFYAKYPKVTKLAHVHMWLGRALLVLGALQGGLGLYWVAQFAKATVDLATRIAYGGTAVAAFLFYICIGIIYPEFRGSVSRKVLKIRNASIAARETGQEAAETTSMRTNSIGTPSTRLNVQLSNYAARESFPDQPMRTNSRGTSIRSFAATNTSSVPPYMPSGIPRAPLPDPLNSPLGSPPLLGQASLHKPSVSSLTPTRKFSSGP